MKDTYIFTYGTLKAGYSNHHYLKDAEFVDDAVTFEKFQMYPCINQAFPFLIKSENIQQIKGEVYKTNSKKLLEELDILEGYPDLYLKESIKVILEEDETIVDALVYFKNEDTNKDAVDYTNPMNEWF